MSQEFKAMKTVQTSNNRIFQKERYYDTVHTILLLTKQSYVKDQSLKGKLYFKSIRSNNVHISVICIILFMVYLPIINIYVRGT